VSKAAVAIAKREEETVLSLTPGSHERYPGPRYFEDNELDQRLFFGREQEIYDLVHRVRATRMLVIFGKSGLGKTSLLRAGLFPRLREYGLLPVSIRLDRPDIGPIEAVFALLRTTCQEQAVDYTDRKTEGLWEFFKATDLWRGDTLQVPVLVFDQFEEVFNLQSESVRVALARQLGELVGRGLPERIRKEPPSPDRGRYADSPPEIKIILSFREEYVGALEQLVQNIPGIFEQRFRLTPLDTQAARRAVVEPALLDLPEVFATRPFRYKKATLDSIMAFLASRQGEVEPFQLQIICQHAEQQVLRRQQEGSKDILVDDQLLGGAKNMEKLLENFYRQAVREISSFRQRCRSRRLCELGLLSPDGHRISMEYGQIRKQYGISENALKTLVDAKLIRKEARPGLKGFYYELSHDSVAGAVRRSRRFRVPTVFKTIFAIMLILGTSVSLFQKREADLQRQTALRAVEQAKLEQGIAMRAKDLVVAQEELAMTLAKLNALQRKAAAGGGQQPEVQRAAQFEKQVAEVQRRTEEAAKRLEEVEQQAKKAAPSPKIERTVILDNIVLFDFDKTALKPDAAKLLDRLAMFFKQNPNYSLLVVWYKRQNPLSGESLDLPSKRAESIVNYLQTRGGIESNRITITSEEGPACPETDRECWARDRGVVLRTVPKESTASQKK
jgi:outer membrane protein OmpA-like peptidoglycan-associated protein